MRNTNQSESIKIPRWRAYTWGVLAALTCPCHLPVLALLLSGTAAGPSSANIGASLRSCWRFSSSSS